MREEADRARLDVWLWRARFFKTRSLATEFVSRKGVRLARGGLAVRKIDKPGYTIAPGDVLAFAIAGHPFHVEILALGVRRGPASEAVLLYNTAISRDEVDLSSQQRHIGTEKLLRSHR